MYLMFTKIKTILHSLRKAFDHSEIINGIAKGAIYGNNVNSIGGGVVIKNAIQ